MSKNAEKLTMCAEHSVFSNPSARPAGQKPLDLSTINAAENQRIISSGKMSFAMVGSGSILVWTSPAERYDIAGPVHGVGEAGC
jgi:hypothetical protein